MQKRKGFAAFGIRSSVTGKEVSVPIGVYSDFKSARVNANAWLKVAYKPLRWEIEPLFEEMAEDEGWE